MNFNIFWGDKFKFLMRFELHLFLGRKGGKKIEKILLIYFVFIPLFSEALNLKLA